MDPVAMTKSALGVLQQFRQQIDDANTTIEEARQLMKHIDMLEVTIMMIPTKSSSSADTSDISAVKKEAEPEMEGSRGLIETSTESAGSAGNVFFNKSGTKSYAKVAPLLMNGIGEYTDMISEIYKSIKKSKMNNLSQKSTKNPSPALVLSDMKNARDEKSNLRIYTDLDVMFCGMVFIVKNALEVIDEAIKSIKELAKIEEESLSCCIPLPWNIQRILAMRDLLKHHASALSEQTVSLQNAIAIASYNVQLQLYESLMDASSNLSQFYDVRELWKKKIGPDKTRTTTGEFSEAMLMSLNASSTGFKDLRKKFLFNNFKYRFSNDNVLLYRYVDELYNTQKDDYISVFELSEALAEIFAVEGNRNKSAFDYTRDFLLEKENKFAASIVFEYIDVDKYYNATKSEEKKKNEKLKRRSIIANEPTRDTKYEVQPFTRILIVAKVPNADEFMNQFDHLVLVKYSKGPNVIGPKGTEMKNADILVEPMKKSKCYVLDVTHDEIAESDSAFKAFVGNEPAKCYFSGHKNWEVVCKDTDNAVDTDMVLIAWSPIVYQPGAYSPRYAASSYMCDGLYDFNQIKCDKSSTTYYKGNMQEYCSSIEAEKEPLGPVICCLNTYALAFAVPDSFDESDDNNDNDDVEAATTPKAVAFSPLYKQRYIIDTYDCSLYSPNLTVLYIFGNIPKKGMGIGLFLDLDADKVLLLEAKHFDGHLYGFEFKNNFRDEASKSIRTKWSKKIKEENNEEEKLNFELLKGKMPPNTKLCLTIEFYGDEQSKKNVEGHSEIEIVSPTDKDEIPMLEYSLFLNEEDAISGDDFVNAAYKNDLETIKKYCEQGGDIHYTDDRGMGAFGYACNAGNLDIAELLIKKDLYVGQLPEVVPEVVSSLLINAIGNGSIDVVNLLITTDGCDLNQQINGKNPFIEACNRKEVNEEIIKSLIFSGCDTTFVTEDGKEGLDCISDEELKQRINGYIQEYDSRLQADNDEDVNNKNNSVGVNEGAKNYNEDSALAKAYSNNDEEDEGKSEKNEEISEGEDNDDNHE